MYKLFVFDIDGTLLTSDHHLPESVNASIQRIKAKGCQFTVATGRSLVWTKPVLDELKVDIPHISSGGSVIGTRDDNHLIFHQPFENDVIRHILDTAYSFDIIGVNFQNIGEVVADQTSYPWMMARIGSLPLVQMDLLYKYPKQVDKVDILGDCNTLLELDRQLKSEVKKLTIFGQGTSCLEITPSGIDKGTALQRLMDLFGITSDQVIVFGNGDNDIPMFEIAHLSIAMGNSHETVKGYADWIAPSNEDEGVAWALHRIACLEQEEAK